ncbi:MAG: transcriptional regulator PpsR [Pseudolabrys sp.]|nr:transcriptional regulator PpsR [Pseudolabrys sp.]
MAAKDSLGSLATETTAKIIAAAADIALVVDGSEVILDTTFSRPGLKSDLANAADWSGRTWTETVTEESRPKVKMLLEAAATEAPAKWRNLSHPATAGGEIPLLYTAVRLRKDRYLAIGRDMRALADLQHRLVEAQTSMERDYSRLRHAETRYRVLFHTTSEPVLIVDAVSETVVEANPAATQLFGVPAGRLLSRNFPSALEPASVHALKSLAGAIRNGQTVDDIRLRLAGSTDDLVAAVVPFRQTAGMLFLLRFIQPGGDTAGARTSLANLKLLAFMRRSPDGYVVVDQSGRIQVANAAFVQMAQLVSEDQAHGEMIDRWLGRSGVDMSVMIANLRHHETVTLFATIMRGEYGASTDVEVSGFSLIGEQPSFGLAVRNVGRRLGEAAQGPHPVPRTVEQLKELIGRVSLKEMVRESTDMIEKLCIEAALELTGDNRASAAEMLGLSRQSLYVKLRRYGMADDIAGAERESS